MKKILIFTGAGVDRESGIKTFRDYKDGLWNNYKIEDVATISGWVNDKQKVLDFYNERRRQLNKVYPNLAHKIIYDLEKYFDITVVTQNVTDLHERAGSTNVIHLHGELYRSKSTFPGIYDTYDVNGDIKIGDKCEKGSQLRHNICFFDEELNPYLLKRAVEAAREADVCIIVGTSMNVSPANMIPNLTKENCLLYYVDPNENWEPPKSRRSFYTHVKEPATIGMDIVRKELIDIFKY